MNRYRIVGVILLCGWVLMSGSCRSVAVHPWTGDEEGDPAFIGSVDGRIRDLMIDNNIPGLSMAVVHDGSILMLRGYGMADRETETPATADTVFRAYSIAKAFTALETMHLAQEGIIGLDDPVATVLPEWPDLRRWDESTPVTIRHLLSHRGGLPRNSNYHEGLGVAGTDCLRFQVDSLSDAWAAYPAGAVYKYSNIGTNVLGRLIENERGELFAIHMSDEVLPAYGMENSAFLISFLPEGSVVATGYEYSRGRYHAYPAYDIIGLASGNLYTGAADMADFMNLLLGSTPAGATLPINHETLVSMYTPQYSRAGDPERNGLGWMTSDQLVGELMVWHQGGDLDANSIVVMFPDSRIGVCILTNTGSFEGSSLLMTAAEIFREVGTAGPVSSRVTLSGLEPSAPAALRTEFYQATGRYIAWGEIMELVQSGDEPRARFGPATLKLDYETESHLGSVYTVRHWLDTINPGGVFPVDLSLLRLIIPHTDGSAPPNIIMAVSDVSYELCPRYPDVAQPPEGWVQMSGDYDHCEVTLEDNALRMSGVGYLAERSENVFEVLGGIYAGETVLRDPAGGLLYHQGFQYTRL